MGGRDRAHLFGKGQICSQSFKTKTILFLEQRASMLTSPKDLGSLSSGYLTLKYT